MSKAPREIPWLDIRGGIYYVFWYDKETKRTDRYSLRTKDPRIAQGAYCSFLTEGRGLYETGASDLTVEAAVDFYEKEHVAVECADPIRQRTAIRHLKAHFGASPLRLVDIPACRRYAAERRKEKGQKGCPISSSTIRRELTVLKAAARHAIRWKRLTLAEMPVVELTPETTKPVGFYTREELNLLIFTADDELKRYMRILYYTGSRRGAIERMEIGQVDFTNNVIHLAKPNEKRTKKRRPPVPLFPEIRADVEALVVGAKLRGSDHLFGKSMYMRYRRHCERHGLGHKAHPHVMRHTRATLCLNDGTSIYDVAKLLGDSVATVEASYGHSSPEYLRSIGGGL